MISKLIKSTVVLSLMATVAFSADAVRFNVISGDQEEKYEKEFLPSLEGATGFSLSDPHEKIDDAFLQRYGNPKDPDYDKAWTTNLDNLGFFSISNDKALYPIIKKAPQIAGFSPFNLLIYKNRAEDVTYVGHIDPTVMLDVTGVKDAATRAEFVKMYEPLDAYVTKEFGGKVTTSSYDKLPANPMMNFEFDIPAGADIADWTESFQENFEATFEDKKYIIAGFKNLKGIYEEDLEMDLAEYDSFFVYGLCHFTYSYNIFNKGRADAGVFAPCSMYFYVKPGTNKMIVGMPRLSVWAAVMKFTDKAKIDASKVIDAEVVSIMKSLGAKEI